MDADRRPADAPTPGARLAAVVLAALVAGAALSGCGPADPAGGPVLDGLLVLRADRDGAADLTLETPADDGEGDGVEGLALPGPATTWVAAGRASVLVATLADGTLHLSRPVDPGIAGPEWRPIEAEDLTGDPAAGPFWFPVWDPEGGRFAALAGDVRGDGEDDVRLVLVDPTTGAAFAIPLGGDVLAGPPAWLGPDLVAVTAGTTTEPRARIVDTATGDIADGPAGARFVVAAADASTVATMTPAGDVVAISETAAWLDGAGTTIGSVTSGGADGTFAWFALDRDGSRLAIARIAAGGGIRVDVYARESGWRLAGSRTYDDGAAGAVVGWLR